MSEGQPAPAPAPPPELPPAGPLTAERVAVLVQKKIYR